MKNTHYVVGLMSGTSIDGIDAAVVKVNDYEDSFTVDLVHFVTMPFSSEVTEKINHLCQPQTAKIEDISMMNMLLGELYAEASLQAIKEAHLTREDILLISSHGQTIFHQPEPVPIDGYDVTSTLQIGDIGVIAERTGITTVGDFRTRDMAVGGQGAPLVPYGDYHLFKNEEIDRILINIGGISNLTILEKDCGPDDVLAYDTGPGNMIMDAFTKWATDGKQTYDKDGKIAASGNIQHYWLESLLTHEYYQLPAPKSTGRELFGIDYASTLWSEAKDLDHHDKIATVTALTAQTIASEIKKHTDHDQKVEVLVSGGGSYNKTLMNYISSALPKNIHVLTTDQAGFSADAKEAIIFAFLGYQCYCQRTNNLPSATGANKDVVMGKIAWGI